jgi:hypothetical protein
MTVSIQRVNYPFAPAHSTGGDPEGRDWQAKLAWPIPAETVRRGDVLHVQRPKGEGGSKLFTACDRKPPVCDEAASAK